MLSGPSIERCVDSVFVLTLDLPYTTGHASNSLRYGLLTNPGSTHLSTSALDYTIVHGRGVFVFK